ncbi:redox-regulated ATPase YchF [Candidatus Roizmanbacteria bacterium]|nr:redox-regulated ATPase YchF [Candidatus Roizmanbacteria bacterium]
MSLKVGIIGLPNAGKSTLFNALLKKQQALSAAYPFATIEPNVGVVPVPDPRLETLATMVEQEEGKYPPIVPATIEFVDIAGLVKDAHKGEGLGNKFLSHIREVSVVCNVLRFFEDSNVSHVAGSIDPKRDQEIIETELIMADLATLEKQAEPRGIQDKDVQKRWELVQLLIKELGAGKPARDVITAQEEKDLMNDLHLLSMKPVLFVCNVSEETIKTTSSHLTIQAFTPRVVVSAKIEEELSLLPEEEQTAYLQELGLPSSGLDRVAQKAYEMLGLISFLTMGIKEVRAWTITRGMLAPQAAGVIHTDFEKKFIKADVISYTDLVAAGSRGKAKETGKLRLEGRTYEMQDGDVVEFKIGA